MCYWSRKCYTKLVLLLFESSDYYSVGANLDGKLININLSKNTWKVT